MLRVVGSVLLFVSITVIFSKKLLEDYFNYKFLEQIENITEKMLYENSLNLPYETLLRKIGFEKNAYIENKKLNRYISSREIDMVYDFFENLGKRDSESEKQYITTNLIKIKRQKNVYLKKYNENKRTRILCGVALSAFVIIVLI